MSEDRPLQELDRAVRDVYRHSLAPLKSEFGKLILLASLRPSGVKAYHHEGLSMLYGAQCAHQALERCHEEVFRGLMEMTLEEQHRDLEEYLQGAEEDPKALSKHWLDQQFYRALIPDATTPLIKKAFLLNCERLLLLIHWKESLFSSLRNPVAGA